MHIVPSSSSGGGISFPLAEGALTFVSLGISIAWPMLGARAFGRAERMFGQLARRKGLAVLVVGLSAFFLRLALLPWFPKPLPFVPDDFSFLLAADTFSHGRLTNPTPAMWVHFESLHIDMLPTYMSMYFPGVGLTLALGTVLFGHPWFALLMVNAFMCASICWMLQGWLPPGWALLGGALAILRLALFSYWINTYTGGGSIAALGGALVLGALPRFMRTSKFGYGTLMAIGIVLVAYTRPYEGVLLSVPVAVTLGRWLVSARHRVSWTTLARGTAIPAGLLVIAGGWMGYYDFRVFGNPLTLPYTVNRATYAVVPYYIWQPVRSKPAYNHKELADFYNTYELSFYRNFQSVSGFFRQTIFKAIAGIVFYSGFALLPPLIMIRRVLLDRRMRFFVLCIGILVVGMAIQIFFMPHYAAPFTAVFYAIGLQCMRHLRLCQFNGREYGRTIVRTTVALCMLLVPLRVFAGPLHLSVKAGSPGGIFSQWFGSERVGTKRGLIERKLEQLPGKQLAVVRYTRDHYSAFDWVYNSADIENAKVIWARDMDAASNRELFDHYRDRKIWLVQPDLPPDSVLSLYPLADQMTAAAH